jgi:hypothetical protein
MVATARAEALALPIRRALEGIVHALESPEPFEPPIRLGAHATRSKPRARAGGTIAAQRMTLDADIVSRDARIVTMDVQTSGGCTYAVF